MENDVMKRNTDGNMSVAQKRSRPGSDDPEIRLLIPSKVAGSIIGKGGNNISRLRTSYNASVTIPDCPGPERIVTICTDYDTALKVIEEIIPNLEEYFKTSQRGKNDELDIKLLVHQSQAGCIIGKAGIKVKELREKTGARIKIFGNCCPQSTDRVVAVAGTGVVCLSAIREVIDLVKLTPIKGYNEQYDPHHFDEDYAEEYGGYGGGLRGGLREMGNQGRRGGGNGGMGVPMGRLSNNPRDRQLPPLGRSGYLRGGGGPVYGGGSRGTFGDGGGRRDDLLMNPPMGPGPQGGMIGNGSHSPRSLQGPAGSSETQVTIPKDLAGAIIGKAGSRIKKIRSESGAGITIDEPLPGSNDRIITITGSPSQIQMAQYLLQQSVHESLGNRY